MKKKNLPCLYTFLSLLLFSLLTMAPMKAAEASNQWLLHSATPLEQEPGIYEFLGGDFNGDGCRDLFAIKMTKTDTKSTEVHVLDGKNRFQSFLLQTGTALENSFGVFSFLVGDYNRDGHPDLYGIKRRNTDSNRTELHILDGKTGFRKFLLHIPLPMENAHDIFSFCLGDYNGDGFDDLYVLKMKNTDSKRTEVYVLDGKNRFRRLLLQTATCLENSHGIFSFSLGDYNNDGKIDLYAIKQFHTGTKSTEVHVMDGAANYNRFLLHTGTILEEARGNFLFDVGDYNGDKKTELCAIKTRQAESGRIEIHILGGFQGSGAAGSKRGLLVLAPEAPMGDSLAAPLIF